MKCLFLVLAFHSVIVSGGALAAEPLTIGSPAPALKVDTWVKGDPIRAIEKGQAYVVEFWGTTCGPCIRCMPHLSELQRQYPAVMFACLDNEPEQTIRAFVAKNDKNMGFRVGIDENGEMWKSWMSAAGLEGIPAAFIVDTVGQIAWIGDPAEMDKPLQQILQGKFDPQSTIIALRFEIARKEAFKSEGERLERGNLLATQAEELLLKGKAAEAVALVDQAIQKDPSERVWYGLMKLQALVADPMLADEALADGIELAAFVAAGAKLNQPTHQVLLDIAFTLCSPYGDTPRDSRCCDLSIELVKRAEELERQEKRSAERNQIDQRIRIDSILSDAYTGTGEFDKGLAHAQRALQTCRTALPPPNTDEKQFRQKMENMAKTLGANLAPFRKKARATSEE